MIDFFVFLVCWLLYIWFCRLFSLGGNWFELLVGVIVLWNIEFLVLLFYNWMYCREFKCELGKLKLRDYEFCEKVLLLLMNIV